MFVGECKFSGITKIMNKEGKTFEILKVVDGETGDFCELFLSNDILVPPLKMFEDCKVKIKMQNRQVRLVSIEKAV